MTWRHENQQVVEQPKCNFQKMPRYIRVLEVKVFAITTAGVSGAAIALQLNYKIPNSIFFQAKLYLGSRELMKTQLQF